ncbi:DUF2742 domain-containing protein [Pseudarthrobacter scleromae]|uniref:DUF2742 domain-containing protein n=1 Tax=Pseudarthrobacter scleromae TaxID=158897 RepID=UPI003D066263
MGGQPWAGAHDGGASPWAGSAGAGQALVLRFSQPQTAVAANSTRPISASHSSPSITKPRMDRTSQIISSVMMSPIPEA